jgi:AraC-like DNA-binding protein
MIPLNYQENYSKKSFLDLIRVFGEPDEHNNLKLDPSAGTGSIQVLDIEEGLQIRIWDCNLHTELNLHRQQMDEPGQRTFTLVFYLTPESFKIESSAGFRGNISELWNTVFLSSDADLKLRIVPGKDLQCLSINFTSEWLENNLLIDEDFKDHFIAQTIAEQKPFIIFESLTHNEELVINNLFYNKYHQAFGRFFFRSKALNLLTEFFIKIKKRESAYAGASQYHETQIINAEKKIVDNIGEGLPDLKKMAHDLSMSESTLKRYFRKMYGKNIYQYYLEKKMQRARDLLDKQSNTVTEVAYMMGYEKVSQFILMFKRFYGVQPGLYQRQTATGTYS